MSIQGMKRLKGKRPIFLLQLIHTAFVFPSWLWVEKGFTIFSLQAYQPDRCQI